jgi:hypothetical protein
MASVGSRPWFTSEATAGDDKIACPTCNHPMQIHLDPRTLLVIAALVIVIPTATGALVWRSRRIYPGFGRWTVGNLLDTLCLVFLSLRGMVPDWITMVLANAAALGASVLFFQGSRKFRGLRLLWWPECLIGSLGVAAIIYFRYVTDSASDRAIVWSVALGIFGVACGITFLRDLPAGRKLGLAFTGTIFLLAGVAQLFRGFYTYMYEPQADLLSPSTLNQLVLLGVVLVIVGRTFGFFLMAGERLLQDAKQTRDGAAAAGSPAGTHALGRTVPDAEVRRQLQRIVESDVFRRSARMERFLSLAVERTLIGEPEKLKEYALGRDVFNRDEDYDPRTDSIVRVEAQRLRRKVREYYASYGRDDLVIVEFHSGSYVPLFRYRELDEISATKGPPVSSTR